MICTVFWCSWTVGYLRKSIIHRYEISFRDHFFQIYISVVPKVRQLLSPHCACLFVAGEAIRAANRFLYLGTNFI